MPLIAVSLGCSIQRFPCTYLGMLLSDSRLRTIDLQPGLDKLAGKVKKWIKGCFSFDARLLLVKHVLSAMSIYQFLVLDAPIWLIKVVDKIRRGFLWDNAEITSGGKFLVQWKSMFRQTDFGGLGIQNLQAKDLALRIRWL